MRENIDLLEFFKNIIEPEFADSFILESNTDSIIFKLKNPNLHSRMNSDIEIGQIKNILRKFGILSSKVKLDNTGYISWNIDNMSLFEIDLEKYKKWQDNKK